MSDSPDLAAVTAGPAEDLVEGRLRDGRRHRLQRRRGPRRGARARPRRAGARRRLRQRQRRDRRGAADLGRRGRRRLRPGPARARPRAGGGRAARASSSSRPTPRTSPSRTASFDVAMSIFGAMFAPDQPKTAAELLRVVKPGGRIGMAQLDARTAPSARCSRRSPSTRRRRPGSNRRCSGAPRSGCASCSATASPTCGSSAASRGSRSAPPTTTSSSSAPTSARPDGLRTGRAEGEQALTDDLRAFLEADNTAGDRALVLEAEYLQVIATRA